MIVYVSVGNDGERLAQASWAMFATQVEGLLIGTPKILSTWYSLATAPWQTACWRIELAEDELPIEILKLKASLVDVGRRFSQPVSWEEVASSETLNG